MLANLVLAAFSRPLVRVSATQTLEFLWSVAAVVPAVMVIMALFEAWVPHRLVEAGLGRGSGARGMALALLLGSAAAGPLFAAFPIACSPRDKGARLANGVIFAQA